MKTMGSSPSKISQNFSFIMGTPAFFQLQFLITVVTYISKVFLIKFRETTNLNDFFAAWFWLHTFQTLIRLRHPRVVPAPQDSLPSGASL